MGEDLEDLVPSGMGHWEHTESHCRSYAQGRGRNSGRGVEVCAGENMASTPKSLS